MEVEKNYNTERYNNNRKKYTYYKVINEILNILEDENKTALDIGSCGVDVLGEHKFKKRYSVSLSGSINDDKTQGFEMDFFDFEPEKKLDIVTCFQVIEHVERAYDFTQKILKIGNTAVISLPYKWYKGHNYTHIQDPVDEKKIFSWTKLKPKHTFYVVDDNNYKCRIICIYGNLTREQNKLLTKLEHKYFDFVNTLDYLLMSSKKPHFLDVKYSNIFERFFSIKDTIKKKYKKKIITFLFIKIKVKQKHLEKFFSIKEQKGKNKKIHKVVTILGIRLKFKIKEENNE